MNGPRAGGWALVTGASTGIGREIARLAARDGWSVVAVARTRSLLEDLAADLGARRGVEVLPIAADLTEPGAADRVFDETRRRGIEVDFLVNNAGVGFSGWFHETASRRHRVMVSLNVGALVELTSLVIPGMVERGRGRILNVGSAAGFVPGLGFTTYAATKSFVLYFTEGLAAELRGTGVTASLLAPAAVATPFLDKAGIPEPPRWQRWSVADARDVARAGYRGALRGRVLIVPGFGLPVALLSRLFPRRSWRWIGRLVARRFLRNLTARKEES